MPTDTVMRPIRACLLFLAATVPALAQAPEKPNFIVLFADDQGWGDLGVYGHPDIRTPHIDRMAAEGMRFTSFYAAPFCGPSRAALMTGSYPPRASLGFNHGPKATTGIHPDEITVAELLGQRGYVTQMIGKWHLGDAKEFLPHRHGFDSWFGIPFSNDMWRYHPVMPIREPEDERMISARERADMTGFAGKGMYYNLEKGQGFPHPLPLMRDDEVLEEDSDQRKLTTLYTSLALDFIETNRDRPFFLYLPYAMPHVPLFVANERWGKSLRGRYGDVIEELDWSVGEILDKLRGLGLDRRTLVVYTSDNGPWLQYGIDAGSAGSFKLGKGTTWEGGMRVPGIFWMPGSIPGGRVSSAVAANMDLLPTFGDLAGAELPQDRVLDGRNLWPLLSGQTDDSPHEYFYFFAGSPPGKPTRLQAIRKGRHKLRLKRAADGGFEATALYDLLADAGEKFDIAERHPGLVRELLAEAQRFVEELEADVRPLGRSRSSTPRIGTSAWEARLFYSAEVEICAASARGWQEFEIESEWSPWIPSRRFACLRARADAAARPLVIARWCRNCVRSLDEGTGRGQRRHLPNRNESTGTISGESMVVGTARGCQNFGFANRAAGVLGHERDGSRAGSDDPNHIGRNDSRYVSLGSRKPTLSSFFP